MATYTIRECILDHIAASGPQELCEIAHECRTQVPDYKVGDAKMALNKLVETNVLNVEHDGENGSADYYDFSPRMYDSKGMLKDYK